MPWYRSFHPAPGYVFFRKKREENLFLKNFLLYNGTRGKGRKKGGDRVVGNFRVIIALVGVISLVAVGFVLNFAQAVFIPLIMAWLLSYIFGPTVRILARLKIPHFINVAVVLALFFGICFLSVLFVNQRVVAFTTAFPRYYARLVEIGQTVTKNLDLPADFFLGAPYFEYKLQKAFAPCNAAKVKKILDTVSSQIGRYLSALTLISAVTGMVVWAALKALHVDFAVTWGVLAFILNFIPTVGSIVASIPPVLVALVQFYPRFTPAVATALALLAIQMSIGNLITPKVMGDRLNLSPVVVLISLLFWGLIWGVVGALISVIIAAIIKIVCENIPSLNFISVMMGSGRDYKREFEEQP